SAYSLTSRGCVGNGGGTITKALTDWNYASIIMPARSITRAPSRCSTRQNQRIVVQYQLWYYGIYDRVYHLRANPVAETIVGPGGSFYIAESVWGGSYNDTIITPTVYYRTVVKVWWERPNRTVYGYKIYTSNSNGDYACYTVNTINGPSYCEIGYGAVRQEPGIWALNPSA
ncbi:MAG TPA: hypothetical protein VLK89_04370, partial [Solirubrobacterales bacterium]|nr:hypothetical protein [Solirubrobacterales bacterium]